MKSIIFKICFSWAIIHSVLMLIVGSYGVYIGGSVASSPYWMQAMLISWLVMVLVFAIAACLVVVVMIWRE